MLIFGICPSFTAIRRSGYAVYHSASVMSAKVTIDAITFIYCYLLQCMDTHTHSGFWRIGGDRERSVFWHILVGRLRRAKKSEHIWERRIWLRARKRFSRTASRWWLRLHFRQGALLFGLLGRSSEVMGGGSGKIWQVDIRCI